jgi:branched-chain amino acid transport system substrate-binding protein
MRRVILAIAMLLLVVYPLSSASAKDRIKIGYLTTLSGQYASYGQDMLDGFTLFLKQHDGKLGGVPVDIVTGDDNAQPNQGLQVAQKLVEQDHVDIISGFAFTPVLLAAVPEAFSHGVFVVSSNGAPANLAGKECNPYFFTTSAQQEDVLTPLGGAASKLGFKRMYIMGMDLSSARAPISGFKKEYTGTVVAEVYTPFQQLDYAAELAKVRAAKPDALLGSYSSGIGINFLKQYAEAGLGKEVQLFSPYSEYGEAVLNAIGDAAVGAYSALDWDPSMKTPGNAEFVRAFQAAYHRVPSGEAAHSYDAALLLDAGIRGVKGRIEDKEAFSKALESANVRSLRGAGFKMNVNHYPMLDWYLARLYKDPADGKSKFRLMEKIAALHKDNYYQECKMPTL